MGKPGEEAATTPNTNTAAAVPSGTLRSMLCKAGAKSRALLRWQSLSRLLPRGVERQWQSLIAMFAAAYNFVVKVPWVIAITVVAVIVVQGLTQQVTVIEPISVPKELADNGYTADVAARRLRDALDKFTTEASSLMRSPGIAMHGDVPNIVVPSVGISLDAVISSIRTFFHSTRSRTISGELTIRDGLLGLKLRLDGRTIDIGDNSIYPRNPDALFEAAAPKIMDRIRPYLVAVSLDTHGDSEQALRKANEIIASLPGSDENVVWAHNLRGAIYRDRKQFD